MTTADVEALHAQLDAMKQLLEVYETTSVEHATRLEHALAELEEKSRLLVSAEQEQADAARHQAAELQVQVDRAATYQKELEEKLATIEAQQAAIREMSTPIIEVWRGVLCLPVIGVVDSERSASMTEALLGAIVATKARCAIIDVTGISLMDTGTTDHFLRMARSVKMLGAECMLTGITPAVAQALIHVGADPTGLATHRTVFSALQAYVRRRGSRDGGL